MDISARHDWILVLRRVLEFAWEPQMDQDRDKSILDDFSPCSIITRRLLLTFPDNISRSLRSQYHSSEVIYRI